MAWVMKTTLLGHATTAALHRIQNPCLSRKQGMLSFAPSPLLILFSLQNKSWKTLAGKSVILFAFSLHITPWRSCSGPVCLATLHHSHSIVCGFEVKFSLASPECDSGKPRLQEAVSVTALWVCHCGYGRSYKTQAATWLLEAGTCFSWVPSPIRKMGPSMDLVYRLEGSCLLIFMFHYLLSVVSCFLNCFVSFVTTARGINFDTDFDYVYGPEPLRTRVSKLPGLPQNFAL